MNHLTHYQPEPEDFTQHKAIGVAIVSFFIAAAVSPFTGIGVALYFVHRHLDKEKLAAEKQRKEQAIEDGKVQYLQNVRQTFELSTADRPVQIPRNLSYHDGSLGAFIEAMEAHEEKQRAIAKPEGQAIGNATRLGAVEVPAVDVEAEKAKLLAQMREHGREAQSVPIQTPSIPQVATAWDSVIADPMRSRAIFGGQRTGKSYFAAAASAEIKRQKNTRIFHLNLHSFGDEDGYYWKHSEQSISVDLSAMDFQQAKVVVQSAVKLVEAFYKTPNAILIFDEITIVGATNSRYRELVAPLLGFLADKITILTSSGKKRQQAIWCLAPEMVAANLTQSAKAIKSLSLLYISVAPGKSVDWEGQAIGASLELWSQLNANYTVAPLPFPGEFECDRIVCIDAEWIPLGNVPKLEPDSHKLDRLMKVEAEDVPLEEEVNFDPEDPIIDLIGEVPDRDKREALMIAYQWATKRLSEGKPVDKESFLQRARNERRCSYLKDSRDAIWDELSGLIS
jgi:hypothetical protein